MNLMNVLTSKWDDDLLHTVAVQSSAQSLVPIPCSVVPSSVGQFSPECIIAPGDALLSLGTCSLSLLLRSPADTPPKRFTTSDDKNGALAREHVRDRDASYDHLVESTPVGNDSHMAFYFPLPEIIPPNVLGEFFFTTTDGRPTRLDSIPSEAHPRAILVHQLPHSCHPPSQLAPSPKNDHHWRVLCQPHHPTARGGSLWYSRIIAESKEAAGMLFLPSTPGGSNKTGFEDV
ncbi:hypothetical protein JVT61DRAFT_242 [Boletus reticuloceps]|uniref:Uncharacterized protein n=1 Tax=Boletus reticuloceps TaxID=495285 RepID=A0A8I2Z2K6_9AGAM|nr:hypothetical protein JVT61DRAFT_242 [Boletus reticuloceps]